MLHVPQSALITHRGVTLSAAIKLTADEGGISGLLPVCSFSAGGTGQSLSVGNL